MSVELWGVIFEQSRVPKKSDSGKKADKKLIFNESLPFVSSVHGQDNSGGCKSTENEQFLRVDSIVFNLKPMTEAVSLVKDMYTKGKRERGRHEKKL